jgi:adenylate cyclase
MGVGGRRVRWRRAAYVLGFGLLTLSAVLAIALVNVGAFARLSAIVFDGYQRLHPREPAGAPIAVVDIDEASIRTHGQWPWPRTDIAAIVDRLTELGAAAIAFDILFSEPDRTSLRHAADRLAAAGAKVELPDDLYDNDDALAAAFVRSNVVVGFVLSDEATGTLPPPKAGFAYAGADPKTFLLDFRGGVQNLPLLTDAAAGAGFFSFPPSEDGVVRVVPLVARFGDDLLPQLAVETLRVAQEAGSFVIRATGASGEADTGRPAMTALKIGEFEAPTGPAGGFRIYYSGLPDLPRIPAARLLNPEDAAEFADVVAGRIVFVGSSAAGLRDLVATPLSPAYPGVSVHAEIVDQILGGTFLVRPDWALGAEVAAAVLLTAILLSMLLTFGPVFGAIAATLLAALIVSGSWLAFAFGHIVLDPILPAITVLAVYLTDTALLLLLTDRDRQFVRRAFSQYLAPALVERVAEDPAALALGGETRELTVMFCDIRGFTTLSETLEPDELTRLLNSFLTPMTDVLLSSGATIDKYVGDAIMAFWNAPLAEPDHPRRACLAVLEMMRALDELNRVQGFSLKIGVGVNTGPCCVGNLGSAQRFSYSAIGDTVNVASRVESLTKEYGLPALVTEHTAARCGDLALLEVDIVRVRGRNKPISLFVLVGDAELAASEGFQAWSAAHRNMIEAIRGGFFEMASAALADARSHAREELLALYDLYAARIAMLSEAPAAARHSIAAAASH